MICFYYSKEFQAGQWRDSEEFINVSFPARTQNPKKAGRSFFKKGLTNPERYDKLFEHKRRDTEAVITERS